MSKIVLDAELKKRLPSTSESFAIEDEQGKPLGHFVPEKEYHRLLYSYLLKTCPATESELVSVRKETGGRTLKEILADLEAS